MLIDLHTHSSCSDGSYSPEELIDFAIDQKIKTIVLCDHDTTSGLSRFINYCENKNITAIPGIEISATWSKGNCHIVGLGLYKSNANLESVLQEIRDSRNLRNDKIIKKLNEYKINITFEEVEHFAGGDVIARPHIAQVLVQKGYVNSVQEAFDRFLAKGKPGYVDRYRLEPEKAISLLNNAGSLPILAHPSQLKRTFEEIDIIAKKFKQYGLFGIEIYTPYTPEEHIHHYLTIAQKYKLKRSGGSDFHGKRKPAHFLGYYRKDMPIPKQCMEIIHSLSNI